MQADETLYRVRPGNHLARKIIRGIGRMLYHNLTRLEIRGLEHVPASGSYLIVFNHISIFDPPAVMVLWPHAPEPLGAQEVWHEPDKKWLARLYGGIPLDRDQYDRTAVERVIQALKSGRMVMMAPEGRLSRQPGMRRARPGVAMIAERAGVPVVPVGVEGTTADFLQNVIRLRRPRLALHIGPAFHLPPVQPQPGERWSAAYQRNADLVMERIAALLPEQYRGIYGAAAHASPQP